jgi:hypothetical protein
MARYLLPLCLGVLLLGVAVFSGVQMAEAEKLRASLTDLGKERAALRKQVWDLQKENRELADRQNAGPFASGGGEPRPVTADGVGVSAPVTAQARPDRGGLANAMMNSPEAQQLMAIQQKAGLDGRYAALFKKLNLSPDELEKFKSLLVEKQGVFMEVMNEARNQGMTGRENRDGIRQLTEQMQAEVDGSIRAALGDSAYAEYKNYENTMPQRGVVGQLAQRLSYSSTPLNDIQSEQLVQILAANTPPAANRGNRANPASALVQSFAIGNAQVGAATAMFGGAPISDTVIAQAQGVLMPAQVTALQSLQQEQQAASQLMQQMRALNRGGPQNTGATGR